VTPPKTDEDDDMKVALRAVTTYFERAPTRETVPAPPTTLSVLECISRSYKIVDDMKEMPSRREARGDSTDAIRSSILIQEKTIAKLELQLTHLMGLPAADTGSGLDISN
jgi:hypothetical protein